MTADEDRPVEPAQRIRTWPSRDRLTSMLAVQRRQRQARDAEVRGSAAWGVADASLDRVNARLWHLAATGGMPPDTIADGVNADIDSVPEDDEAFRGAVVHSIREAVADRIRRDRETETHDRVTSSARKALAALAVMARAQERLRRTYPGADLFANHEAGDTIGVVAFRDGEVA